MDSSKSAKVLILQFEPVYKNPKASIQRAQSIIKQFSESDQIDIVLLPEIAFAGYVFKDLQDISPFLEKANQGPTYQFCKKWAAILKAYVVCGYAEVRDVEGEKKYYNSQLWVSQDGTVVKNYSKHFLFMADQTWAMEGPSFQAVKLNLKSGLELKLGCGICKDIQARKDDPPTNFELSSFYEKEKCDLILFSTGWVTFHPSELEDQATAIRNLHQYWMSRLAPLISGSKLVYFCASNRTGAEGGWTFFGSSCFLKILPNQKPQVLSFLGIKQEGFILETLQY